MRTAARWEATISILFFVVALTLLPGAAAQAQTPKPDFSGTWELNIEQSDDPFEAIRSALGLTGGSGDRQQERQALSSRLNYVAQAAKTIEIEHTQKDFKLFNTEDDVRIHYIDGQKHPRQSPTGERMTTVTVWRGDLLDSTTEGDEIGKVSETFGLEGQQLVHIVRIQNDAFDEDLVIRAYYDRAEQ